MSYKRKLATRDGSRGPISYLKYRGEALEPNANSNEKLKSKMNILISYFSATGNTGRIARAICERLGELGAQVDIRDVTALESRQNFLSLDQFDAVIFGSSLHSMRSPRLFREWLQTLDGRGKRCALFFTYGGFQLHPTHFDTCQRLQTQGFTVVASAEFPDAHGFNLSGWQAMQGRPDQEGLSLAAQYAEKLMPRLNGQDQGVVTWLDPGPYSQEQLEKLESMRFKRAAMLLGRGGGDCLGAELRPDNVHSATGLACIKLAQTIMERRAHPQQGLR